MKNLLPFTLCLVGCLLLAFVGYNLWEQAVVPLGPSKALLPKKLVTVPTVKTVDEFSKYPKSQLYFYKTTSEEGKINFTTYGALSTNLSEKVHLYYLDIDQEVILALLKNDEQDKNLNPLIDAIKKISPDPDTQAKITISLVQHLPYGQPKETDWYYPYETLYNDEGVCADKSLLLVYILNKLGYDTVLFNFETHMAVGVKSLQNYSFRGTGYAFIETTTPQIITYIPSYDEGIDVNSDLLEVIYVKGQNKTLDVSTEYKDARRLEQLNKMGKIVEGERVLKSENYAEWQSLIEKYNLTYKT